MGFQYISSESGRHRLFNYL